MTPGEAQAMEDASETVASDFEQTLAGMAEGAEFAAALHDGAGEDVAASANDQTDNSAMIAGLPVMMKVVLGSAKMPVATLAKLAKGSVVKLDKMVGDPVDILVNGRLIARGEVVVLNEGSSRFGVVLTQVGGPAPSAK
jgi:flagellar motor switch protein FliN/FliY